LPTYLALKLGVEHMPECTDTASHVQTICGDRRVSYSIGIWFFP